MSDTVQDTESEWLRDKHDMLHEEIARLIDSRADVAAEVDALNIENDALTAEVERLREAVELLQEHNGKLARDVLSADGEALAFSAEVERLREDIENLEADSVNDAQHIESMRRSQSELC